MKRWWLVGSLSLAVFAGLRSGVARADPSPPVRDIGREARAVFAAKCAGCHGPQLAKPKGRFGYVLDLRRVAENPEMVIPQRPAESELWALVQRDEMPPPDSPRGPLTSAQKEIIRDWIAAGAPDALPGGSASSPPAQSESTVPASVESASGSRLVRWLGKFHLLLVHFPIALVFAAALAELRSIWQRNPLGSETTRFCLWLAALTAVPTAALGWLFAASGYGLSSPQLLMVHRWLGTSAAAWLVFTALCTTNLESLVF
jgi:mono/diheme cytochrome c family protein